MKLDIDQHLRADRAALMSHPLFSSIRTVEDVQLLMASHVYAVWDFMSLLKRLQREMTCVELPWVPPQHPMLARLINEIVVGEESDEHPGGGHASHMDLYLEAMNEIGADTLPFRRFLSSISRGATVDDSLRIAGAPAAAAEFVRHTLAVARTGQVEAVLAYFFFGREDIIPDMFGRLLQSWGISEDSVPMFSYYLHRHIEMDGDDHGPAAKRMILEVITEPAQHEVLVNAARAALQARVRLWDGVLAQLEARRAAALQPA